jgi:hypothetical protein
MHRSSTLTLVITRLHDSLPVEDSVRTAPGASVLALIAGRGKLERQWLQSSAAEARLETWQRGLVASLGLGELGYPSAPLAALSAGHEQLADWLHAEPVHLLAGMNEVSLVPLQPAFRLTHEEREALTPALQSHLAVEGFQLRRSSNGWLVGTQEMLKVQTVCVDYAMRHEWSVVLPQGDHAGRLRRLMTEMQMLLHEHPINEARAARGIPVVNSVWLWGNGVIRVQPVQSSVPSCFGSDEYLMGICKVNAWPKPVTEHSADDLIEKLRSSDRVVGVLNDLTLSDLESRWLKPILSALEQRKFAQLQIVLDEWRLTINRWQLKKFWRAPLPVVAWGRG